MFKIVDGSAKLGIQSRDVIDTKEKLHEIIKQHFTGLVSGDAYNPPKTKDEQLFWALSTIYVVENDCIFLCDRIGTGYPIYDVEVRKSDKTSIIVKPYKVDYYKEYEILDIKHIPMNGHHIVDPLEVMGWKVDDLNGWEGIVWLRSAFTGWNTINVQVDENLWDNLSDNLCDNLSG